VLNIVKLNGTATNIKMNKLTHFTIVSIAAFIDFAINLFCLVSPFWIYMESLHDGQEYIGFTMQVKCSAGTCSSSHDIADIGVVAIVLMPFIAMTNGIRSAIAYKKYRADVFIVMSNLFIEAVIVGFFLYVELNVDIAGKYMYLYYNFYLYIAALVVNVAMVIFGIIVYVKERNSVVVEPMVEDHVELIDSFEN